jgi:DNA gyrase/topoisomerase IV subunit B
VEVRRFELPRSKAHRNGVVGIMSLRYPDTVWQGCLKTRIGNPELRGMVRNMVVRHATEWLRGRPEVAEQLRYMEMFQFTDAWCERSLG